MRILFYKEKAIKSCRREGLPVNTAADPEVGKEKWRVAFVRMNGPFLFKKGTRNVKRTSSVCDSR